MFPALLVLPMTAPFDYRTRGEFDISGFNAVDGLGGHFHSNSGFLLMGVRDIVQILAILAARITALIALSSARRGQSALETTDRGQRKRCIALIWTPRHTPPLSRLSHDLAAAHAARAARASGRSATRSRRTCRGTRPRPSESKRSGHGRDLGAELAAEGFKIRRLC